MAHINLRPIDSFTRNNSYQFIVDQRFVDDVSYNFTALTNASEINYIASNVSISGLSSSILASSLLNATFEYKETFSLLTPHETDQCFESEDCFNYVFPAGYYLKSSSLPIVPIDIIEDSECFVKMLRSERDFLNELRDNEVDGLSSFRLQVDNNAPLNELTRISAGKTLNISQILANDGIPEVRFESSIPLRYYHLSNYAVIPTRPDPNNPYRWKVRNGPYSEGTLRIYINAKRVPTTYYTQEFATIGEFRFNSNIPLSELPGAFAQDVIFCDFDIPLIESPTDSSETVGWWSFIRTETDGNILEANNQSAIISLQSQDNIIRITSISSTDDNVGFGDIIEFAIDETEIDHNNLKNYVAAEHHLPGSDNQNIWYTINSFNCFDDTIPTANGSITPASTTSTLTIEGYSGILVEAIGSILKFSLDENIRTTRTIYNINNSTGAYSAIRFKNPGSLTVGQWVGITSDNAGSGQGEISLLDATDTNLIRSPLGVIVEEVGSDIIVAYEGIVSETIIGSLVNPGTAYYIDESSAGDISDSEPATSGNYILRIGEHIINDSNSYLWIRFGLPVIQVP